MIYDTAIIGAGPAGIFCSFQAGMNKMSSIIIDGLPYIGGQCTALYPQKPIYDIPGYSKITGSDLIKALVEQALVFRVPYILDTTIIDIRKEQETFLLLNREAQVIAKARSIILATGGGALRPKRLDLKNAEILENKGIYYALQDPEICKNKRLVIAGGGDSAIDWAIYLADIASHIYLVHRRHKFSAIEHSLAILEDYIAKKRIELIIPYQLSQLILHNKELSHIIVEDLDHNTISLEAEILLPFFGLESENVLLQNLDIVQQNSSIIVDYSSMRTNREGIYAIGDIAFYNGKMKLIMTAFSEAAVACTHIKKYLYPNEQYHFRHSTSNPPK